MIHQANYQRIQDEARQAEATLIAVSKTKPASDILELYDLGHRDFGENYVQELQEKQSGLPTDIRWHFIGHLQTNKVKFIAPFVHLIHGVDSEKLLREVDKQGGKAGRVIDVLLQVHIAQEETKFGMNESELDAALQVARALQWVRVRGLMGMASFVENEEQVRTEFRLLRTLFERWKEPFRFDTLSMGMSGDYALALSEGSSMIRIGSLLFGARDYGVTGS